MEKRILPAVGFLLGVMCVAERLLDVESCVCLKGCATWTKKRAIELLGDFSIDT